MIHNTLVLFAGAPGVGKSTLIRKLCQQYSSKYEYVRPYTTRAPRKNENDKIHVNYGTFTHLVKKKKIICPSHLYGNFYGPSITDIHRIIFEEKKIPVIDWPFKRIGYLQKAIPYTTLVFYVLPPDLITLKKRLSGNERESEKDRYIIAKKEIKNFKRMKNKTQINEIIINKGNIRKIAKSLHKKISKRLGIK